MQYIPPLYCLVFHYKVVIIFNIVGSVIKGGIAYLLLIMPSSSIVDPEERNQKRPPRIEMLLSFYPVTLFFKLPQPNQKHETKQLVLKQ